ncbi:MAG: Threonine dehydrogenase and related Zn-dependent dehydrogenases [uncultured Thermomicrobiales bacterium]|uniref:Threonine dehydrogenase and related Zn-dependent dehydrogenases n=1 Tax=uncultured Thermomicrobiales bacterium TaxID=1645740 RepID=A0A6J4UUH9_9BACT|nr:MAG: Threonine dehydrogenase and related Zn-dependent dehydrogenases [uncultured Thermomicrobiales bacterium]
MRIAVLDAPQRFRFEDRPVPTIGDGQALVRVAACGVCTSELHMWDGTTGGRGLPRAIGHEVSGVVERVGSAADGLRAGDRVAVWVTEGGFAEHVAVDAAACFPTGDVPLEQALGEPLACAVNAVELAGVALGDDVVVIGAGFMGNLVQKLVQLRGPRHVIVADTRPDALERAARLGATRTVLVGHEPLPEVVAELTGGRGADVSFEATGVQAALTALGEVTRMSGTVVIVGYHQGGERTIPLAAWNWMAFTIVNAHFREVPTILRGMRTGMRLLASDRLELGDLLTHRFPLADIDRAFRASHEKPPGFCKATVVVDGALA